MKKILAFLLVGSMIFMMSACSYELVDVEDLNKDQSEKVMDDWQEEYRDFFVDVQSDAEDAAKAEEQEKKEAEKKKKEEEEKKKKEEAAKKKEEKEQAQKPIVEDPIVEQVIEQPFISETLPRPEPIPEPTPEPVSQPEPEKYVYDNPPFRGSNNSDVYNNDYAGINIRWPEGWGFLTNADDSSLEKLLDPEQSTTTIYDLLAISSQGGTVQVMYSNLRKSNDEEISSYEFLRQVGESVAEFEEYSCTLSNLHEADIEGNIWSVLPLLFKEDSKEVSITYYCRKIDCFMVTMILSCPTNKSLNLEFH